MSVLEQVNTSARSLSKALTGHFNGLINPLSERLGCFDYAVCWLGDDYALLAIEPQGARIINYSFEDGELDRMMKMSNAELMRYCDRLMKP